MRPNPRWQQQGGRGQGKRVAQNNVSVCNLVNLNIFANSESRYILMSFLFFLLSLSGGFQGIPSSLRQPGPRANLRHMTPGSGAQGPRGVFSHENDHNRLTESVI